MKGCTNLATKIRTNIRKCPTLRQELFGTSVEFPKPCHFCNTRSVRATPDGFGDWWFRCVTCNRSWNLLEDVARRTSTDLHQAAGILVSSGGLWALDADKYVKLSEKKRFLMEVFQRARCGADFIKPEALPAGEWAICTAGLFSEIGRVMEWEGMSKTPRFILMDRLPDGTPSRMTFGSIVSGIFNPTLAIVIGELKGNGTFADGILPSSSMFVTSVDSMNEFGCVPGDRPLFIRRQAFHATKCGPGTPKNCSVTLISTHHHFIDDMMSCPFLLGVPGGMVKFKNFPLPIIDVAIGSVWWINILGFAISCGFLTGEFRERTINKIAKARSLTKDSVEQLLLQWRKTPEENITRDLRRRDGGKSKRIHKWRKVANFQVRHIRSHAGLEDIVLIKNMKRAELTVAKNVYENANSLMVELHSAAKQHKMGPLHVYRIPPYPKNLFIDEKRH